MRVPIATEEKVDKERVRHLVSSVRALLGKHMQGAERVGPEERFAAEDLMEELWQRLDFLTPAEVAKLLLRDIVDPTM